MNGNHRRQWFARPLAAVVAVMLLAASAAVAAEAPKYVVNSPVANMYSAATVDSDVVSQAIYGTNVSVIEEQENWVKLRTPGDDYEGWIPKTGLLALGSNAPYGSTGPIVQVSSMMAHIYREPDVTKHAPLLTVPFETVLEVAKAPAQGGRWIQVKLADARLGWVQQGDVTTRNASEAGAKLTIPEMIALGKKFLGLPYTWGGRSSFGYDCSGFTQMLVRMRGYLMPRDADDQAAWSGLVEVKPTELQAGDLLYFGSKRNITHTGMYIGDGEFIHATTHDRPVIQISKLGDAYWTKLLVAQRRVKP